MKKKLSLGAIVLGISLVASVPASATTDEYATTYANILNKFNANYVYGVASAQSSNSKFQSINLSASFYQGTTKKESGTATSYTKNVPAQWLTANGTNGTNYPSSNSYSINVASRTYYTDGTSSDQSYDYAYWN
ncbi:hypothetical protein FHR92_003208 [Fontibacillus solani]|uniref:Uncharacterized protein n=2 Tax=Fontibacillus TaxID=995014 RepID=A0A1G7RCQ1_9BACL|nr:MULTISPECIES: hypothetical protein [Fontibacillus]MBA9086728.1 hypothetical protein [Fontibacillus solani]SDG08512.1 hypothetical protein SAMN04488542_12577 [Fontibacillus panacisegetis]